MPEPSPQDLKTAAIRVTVIASVSLGLMLVEFLWLVRDEVKYVWPKLRSSWTARIFVFTRYVGLASQVFNVFFAVRMYLGIGTSPTGCRLWYSFQAIVVQSLLFFVEALLMHRIYALFLRSRSILIVLVMFFLAQMVSMLVSARLVFPTNQHTTTCMLVRSNPSVTFFSATTMTTNLGIFFMTFWKYIALPTRWSKQGLGRVVFRDSALSLTAISGVMLFLTLCSLGVIKPHANGNTTYYWLVGVLWACIGRIVVNHEKLQYSKQQGVEDIWNEALQITSQIEMGVNTLTLGTERVPSEAHGSSAESPC